MNELNIPFQSGTLVANWLLSFGNLHNKLIHVQQCKNNAVYEPVRPLNNYDRSISVLENSPVLQMCQTCM